MFISFEGIDGCGKSTQIELLKDYFESKATNVLVLREPGGTTFAEEIREILLHSKNEISSNSELFLFEAARADLTNQIIKPSLDKDIVVLIDRFFDSTTAYQGFGRGLEVNQVIEINKMATHGLEPDVTFYLHVDLNTSLERCKYKTKDRIESAGIEFFNKVISGFEKLCEMYPHRIIKVDAEGSVIETHNNILKIIEEKSNKG